MHQITRFLETLYRLIRYKLVRIDRIEFLKLAFALAGVFILWTTFRLTVLEHDYYRTLADKQQTITVKNPVSRGTIYSVNSPA